MTQPTQFPTATVTQGDTISVQSKNPFTSTAVWGLIVMLISWAANRWVPKYFQDQAIQAALEVAGFLAGAALTLYGRWRATRPLGSGAMTTTAVK